MCDMKMSAYEDFRVVDLPDDVLPKVCFFDPNFFPRIAGFKVLAHALGIFPSFVAKGPCTGSFFVHFIQKRAE